MYFAVIENSMIDISRLTQPSVLLYGAWFTGWTPGLEIDCDLRSKVIIINEG